MGEPSGFALKCQSTEAGVLVVGGVGVTTTAGVNCHGSVGSGVGVAAGSAPAGVGAGPSGITWRGVAPGGVGWFGLVMPFTIAVPDTSTCVPSRLPVLTIWPPDFTVSVWPAWMPEAMLPSTERPAVWCQRSPPLRSSCQTPLQSAFSAMAVLSTPPLACTSTLRPPLISPPLLFSDPVWIVTSRAPVITPTGPAAASSSARHWLLPYVPPGLQPPA